MRRRYRRASVLNKPKGFITLAKFRADEIPYRVPVAFFVTDAPYFDLLNLGEFSI